nr:hypothetical protein [bacterium]
MECHGADLTGGWSDVSCLPCHVGQDPHSPGWVAPSQHGADVADGGNGYCAGCHGLDDQGGTSGTSCYQGHDGPSGHPGEWKQPESHGDEVIDDGPEACA